MHLENHDDRDLDERSTVKLQLPKRQHLRLHCLKILTGQTMSDIATEAFERYFEEADTDEDLVV